MAPYFFGDFSDNDYSNDFKEVPIRRGIGRGKEGRVILQSEKRSSRERQIAYTTAAAGAH